MKRLLSMGPLGLLLMFGVNPSVWADGTETNQGFQPAPRTAGARYTPGDIPDIFLRGNFIEIGLSDAGNYGASGAPPAAFAWPYGQDPDDWTSSFNAGYTLGFVADFERNGWDTSSTGGFDPAGPLDASNVPNNSGDYFLPGDPWEGFLVEYTIDGTEYTWRNCGACGEYDVTPVSLADTSSGDTRSALWVGLADSNSSPRTGTPPPDGASLEVRQQTFFDVDDAQFFIAVTLLNNGTESLSDVEYARHFDPDNEQNWTGSYATVNYVTEGFGSENDFDLAEVVALGRVWDTPLALRLFHPDAVAHVNASGLKINSPDTILDSPNQPTEASPLDADVGIGVAVRFASLAPGESETFIVSYVLNIEDISEPTDPPAPPPEAPEVGEALPVPVGSWWSLGLLALLLLVFASVGLRRSTD